MRRGDFNLKAIANMKPMVEGQTQKRKEKNTFFELFIAIRPCCFSGLKLEIDNKFMFFSERNRTRWSKTQRFIRFFSLSLLGVLIILFIEESRGCQV